MSSIGQVTLLDRPDDAALRTAVSNADALLVRTATRVDSDLLRHAPRLRVIGRAGVGLDNIDLEAAQACGIQVVYTPAASTEAVADLTMGLILALERKFITANHAACSGRFEDARHASTGRELSSLKIGVVGLGRIGRAVARRAVLGFGMTLLYNDIIDPGPLEFPSFSLPKHELFSEADVISLHVPLTEQTRCLINQASLALFKPKSLLVNTARGAVVDHQALGRALMDGVLGGAGLDVTDPEPLPPRHLLWTTPNVIVTPHIGARTSAALARMNAVVEDVALVLQGQLPRYPVTGQSGYS